MKRLGLFIAFVAVLPVLSFADNATTAGSADFSSFLTKLGGWIGTIGKLIIAATVVAFFWGLFMFVFSEGKKDEGKSIMGWGIVALFVMVSIWGIIGFLQSSTGISKGQGPVDAQQLIPTINSKNK